MPVFVSWSGKRSRALAEALRRFLPLVIQRLPIFMSGNDIASGTRWANVIEEQLKKATFGILCVTPENRDAPWLNFEAGAVSNAVGQPRVAPLLLGLSTLDIGPPLSLFQAVTTARSDVLDLIRSINEVEEGYNLEAGVLDETFEAFWPRFEQDLKAIPPPDSDQAPARSEADVLNEILSLLRPRVEPVERSRFVRKPKPQRYSYSVLWGAIRTKLNKEALVEDFDVSGDRPDFIISDQLAIQTLGIGLGGSLSSETISGDIHLVAATVRDRNLVGGIVVFGGDLRKIDMRAVLDEADEKGVGVAVFENHTFYGNATAASLAPWLIDAPLR